MPLKTENSTATGFVYDNIHQKRSKSWDMRYYWLRDRMTQQQFDIFWESGVPNEADYFTKHHATVHHQTKRLLYVKDKPSMDSSLQHPSHTLSKSLFCMHQSAKTLPRKGVLQCYSCTDGQTTVWPPILQREARGSHVTARSHNHLAKLGVRIDA